MIASAYKLGLTHHGFEIIIARDGREALAVITQHRPHIVLLDVIMPHMTGIEVLAAIRENPALQTLPVIILSNLDQPDDIARANELGAKAYLIKANLSLKDLVAHIQDAIETGM